MKQIRKRLTYANVMSSIAVFLILGGASAIAANQLGKNTVGTKQLKKNAVTAAKIKKNAITTVKVKDGSITGAKVKAGSLTGSNINLGTLGTVPSATTATTANTANTANTATTATNLAGQHSFFIRLGFGGSQTIATNGAVSLVMTCSQEGGEDFVRILEQTSVSGAVAAGSDDYEGTSPTDFLEPGTPPQERELVEENETSGKTRVDNDIDDGFVLGPEGKMITANTEGIALGLNYGSPGCLTAGVVNLVG